MKFTSIPQNGSSWHDSLPVSFDTELPEASDVVLRISGLDGLDITRRLYGVTQATVDIQPYLMKYSCRPPQIGTSISLSPSRSSQRLQLTIGDVISPAIALFHTPFSTEPSSLLSSCENSVTHPVGVPILLTAVAQRQLTLSVVITTSKTSTTQSYVAKTSGMPMDIVIPSAIVNDEVRSIRVNIGDEFAPFASVTYNIVKMGSSATTLVWFNRSGGIESYTFPSSLRVSYDAQLTAADSQTLDRYQPLSSAKICYRLCSAYEPPQRMDRLAELVFSPRIFRLDGDTFTPISLCRRVEFDSHGALKQMSLEVEQDWKGGVR